MAAPHARLLLLAAVIGLAQVCGAGLTAQPYPDRPIKVLVGFPAGSGADIIVRYFTDKLAGVAGVAVIVENKPGVSGNIASDLVAKSKPDGTTILMSPSSAMAGNMHVFKSTPFDVQRDFVPVASLASIGFVLTVGADHPAKSLGELTSWIRAKDGKATYAYASTTGQSIGALYLSEAGAKATSVPYKISMQALADVAAGQVDFMFNDIMFTLGQERQGKVRLLASSTPQRVAVAPHVPTMVEAGLPKATLTSWWGAYLPTRTPPDIVASSRLGCSVSWRFPRPVRFWPRRAPSRCREARRRPESG